MQNNLILPLSALYLTKVITEIKVVDNFAVVVDSVVFVINKNKKDVRYAGFYYQEIDLNSG